MSRPTLLRLGAGGAVALLALGCIRTETGDGDASSPWAVVDTIAQRWEEYRDILIRGDARALASMFTVDAILMEPDMDAFRGRDAIERFANATFERFTLTKVSNRTTELTVHDDTAFEFGTYVEIGGTPDESPRQYPGRYVTVWRRSQDGRWRIHRMMVHSLMRQEAP